MRVSRTAPLEYGGGERGDCAHASTSVCPARQRYGLQLLGTSLPDLPVLHGRQMKKCLPANLTLHTRPTGKDWSNR